MYIIIFVAMSVINCSPDFDRRLHQLRQCAAVFGASRVPNECVSFAKHGLTRNGRANRRLYVKSKEMTCNLPCQKARLYTKPKVLSTNVQQHVFNGILSLDIESVIRWLCPA